MGLCSHAFRKSRFINVVITPILQNCSWAYEDPDADHRADFDGPPIEVVCLLNTMTIVRSLSSRSGVNVA
jgi:hypothetical protein